MHTTAWAEIRLDALLNNLRCARQLAPHSQLMAMIKADAYGHGLLPAARALRDCADGVAVARLDEALALREDGFDGVILLLGTQLNDSELELCASHELALVVHSLAQARQLSACQLSRPLAVWLKLNTGMNRLGLEPQNFRQAHQLLQHSANVSSCVHMTHFSCADNAGSATTAEQITRLRTLSAELGDYPLSMANSAGLIAHPDSRSQWIRPGIMLYGDNPVAGEHPLPLRQVMQLKARVIALHQLRAGESVGYHRTWQARRDSRIAVLGIGYGDGYPRHAPNGTPVLIHGERAALAGRVSMDIVSVDITDLSSAVQLGDEALLWGEGLPAAEIAELAGTISYELFTGVTARVPRIYQWP